MHLDPVKHGMTRIGPALCAGILLATGLAGGDFARAAEPVASTGETAPHSTGENGPPTGLKILYGGDSWHRLMPSMMPEIAKAAGIKGQWADWNSLPEKILPLLDDGKIDVLSWGRPGWMESQGLDWLERTKIIEHGVKGNPNFRIYLQMAWLVHDGLGIKITTKDDYDNSKIADVQAAIDRAVKSTETQADAINKQYGKQVVFLIPLGDALTQLRGRIVDGKFPGVTRQSEVFSDAMPHPGTIAWALMAYCNYAALYRRSPVGLTWNGGVTDEQRAILQDIAWESVSKHPYAGLATNVVPASATTGTNATPAVPAASVAETAVPEALKGWKAVQDLPDDVVVADYNAYIEQLPKAERPGVSDVKYFIDGTGSHAVSILVNVDSTPWTHVLVYDKQNKRLTVSKQAQGK